MRLSAVFVFLYCALYTASTSPRFNFCLTAGIHRAVFSLVELATLLWGLWMPYFDDVDAAWKGIKNGQMGSGTGSYRKIDFCKASIVKTPSFFVAIYGFRVFLLHFGGFKKSLSSFFSHLAPLFCLVNGLFIGHFQPLFEAFQHPQPQLSSSLPAEIPHINSATSTVIWGFFGPISAVLRRLWALFRPTLCPFKLFVHTETIIPHKRTKQFSADNSFFFNWDQNRRFILWKCALSGCIWKDPVLVCFWPHFEAFWAF